MKKWETQLEYNDSASPPPSALWGGGGGGAERYGTY